MRLREVLSPKKMLGTEEIDGLKASIARLAAESGGEASKQASLKLLALKRKWRELTDEADEAKNATVAARDLVNQVDSLAFTRRFSRPRAQLPQTRRWVPDAPPSPREWADSRTLRRNSFLPLA